MSANRSSYSNWSKETVFFVVVLSSLLFLTTVRSYAQSDQKVIISGTIEAEARYSKRKFDQPGKATQKTNDFVLATAEIGIDAEIHPSVKGHILLLWEEDETEELQDLLDEGTITISNPDKCPYYLTFGKMYIPFGSFETVFITDSMTLELAEINETALQIGYKKGYTDISFGFFNGDRDKAGKEDRINCYFANLGLTYSEGSYNFSMGLSYLSSMADTDAFEDIIDTDTMTIKDYTDGLGVFLKADMGSAFLSAEYIEAIDDFDSDLFGFLIRPKTYNVELGWRTPQNMLFALKYEKSKDFEIINEVDEDFDFPEKRYGILLSYPLFKKASLSFEYLHEKYCYENKGKNHALAAQLAINF